MTTTNNTAASTAAANVTLKNSDGSPVMRYLKIASRGVKAIGNSAVTMMHGRDDAMSGLQMIYQDDDHFRARITAYIQSRAKLVKGDQIGKNKREAADKWAMDVLGFSKPAKGSSFDETVRYQNRTRAVTEAFLRCEYNTKRGLRFVMDAKEAVFITAESYNKVMKPDVPAKENVAVVEKTKDATKTTWARLAPEKKKDASAAAVQSGTPVTVTANAENFGIICEMVKKAAESVDAHKMTGADHVHLLNAIFALQALGGIEADKGLVEKYEGLLKAQA